MSKAATPAEIKLMDRLEQIRQTLLTEAFADRIDRRLAFWATVSDRRLPLAFMQRTLREILRCSFEELAHTPGVGPKKMASLLMLLERAIAQQPMDGEAEEPLAAPADAKLVTDGPFDPTNVSELVWEHWRQTVRTHGMGQERLGRLAPSLQSLPTVIWDTPLAFYLDLPLAEIRQLRTHGEKRVRVVLEVFHTVHSMLTDVHPKAGLSIRLMPGFVAPIEDWLSELQTRPVPPTADELADHLVWPLLKQLEVDAGATVVELAKTRLGVGAELVSVRQQAKRMNVTRARIYQLLEEAYRVMLIRWPEGRRQLDELAMRLEEQGATPECRDLLSNLRELLYPRKFESLAEHLVLEAVED
jgi:hypothetical protein